MSSSLLWVDITRHIMSILTCTTCSFPLLGTSLKPLTGWCDWVRVNPVILTVVLLLLNTYIPSGLLFLVNQRSIMSLKRRALRRTKTLARDSETQQVIPPSRISVFFTKLKAPFTKAFWEDVFEGSDNETLVDGKLLSYAYLEAGIIEMLGTWVRCGPEMHVVHTNGIVCDDSLVAYFVLFYKKGFSPNDLRRAQKADGE